jgi:hypothetical protein
MFSTLIVFLSLATVLAAFSAPISDKPEDSSLSNPRTSSAVHQPVFPILSGELHYWRIPKEEWSERIKRIKAAGINAISTPVPWALHEKKPGQIDLSALEEFLKTCQQQNTFVLASIAPNTRLDFLPRWLIAREVPDIGRDSELYLRYVARWYNALCPLMARYQLTKSGPVILVRIDSPDEERMSPDAVHLRTLANAVRERGIEIAIYVNRRLWLPSTIPASTAAQRDRPPGYPLLIAEYNFPSGEFAAPHTSPESPSDFSSSYRAAILSMLLSGAYIINHCPVAGTWDFAQSFDQSPGVYCLSAPLTAAGSFNPSYWPVRLFGQWLISFGPDLLSADEVPPGDIELLLPEPQVASPGQATSHIGVRAFSSSNALFIFLQELKGKPASICLRLKDPISGTSLAVPAKERIALAPHQTKLLVARLKVGTLTVSYSTSEISSRGSLRDTDYIVFCGDENAPGEIALATPDDPTAFSKTVRLMRDGPSLRLNYTHSPEDQFLRFPRALLVITTAERAARTWLIGKGNRSALLISSADFVSESEPTPTELEASILCSPGETHISAFFAEQPDRVLLDGRDARVLREDGIYRLTVKTPSAPSVAIRLKRARLALESSLPDGKAPLVKLDNPSDLARLGFYEPGFVMLHTTLPKNAAERLLVETNAIPPPILNANDAPIAASVLGEGAWSLDLRRKLNKTENSLVITLEFESIPELRITMTPEMNLNWEASPGLKGEWLLLFARPYGPEWQPVTLPQKPPPADIAWYAIPVTLQPKPAWETPLLLQIEAGERASLWLNGRRFVRYTSIRNRDPNVPDRPSENVIPLPYSWLLSGENLLVVAARGGGPVSAVVRSDDAHSLIRHSLRLQWQ